MPISYDRLWKQLIDRKMNKTELKEASGISFNVLARMGKEEPVSMESLEKIETRELVNELRNREGVEIKIIDPYENYVLEVSGPMIVIKVID